MVRLSTLYHKRYLSPNNTSFVVSSFISVVVKQIDNTWIIAVDRPTYRLVSGELLEDNMFGTHGGCF